MRMGFAHLVSLLEVGAGIVFEPVLRIIGTC